MTSETRAGFPAERHADPGEGGSEGMAAPGTGGDECCEALGEGPSGTIRRAAEEAASVDHEGDGATAAGEISNAALIPAVESTKKSGGIRPPGEGRFTLPTDCPSVIPVVTSRGPIVC